MKKLLREFPKETFRKFLDESFNESPRCFSIYNMNFSSVILFFHESNPNIEHEIILKDYPI
jgi:hypothetical protein